MSKFLAVFLFFWVQIWFSQQQKTLFLKKDDFLNTKTDSTKKIKAEDKIIHRHSDKLERNPKYFDNNPFFTGSVVFDHKGSVLSADTVVFYEKLNFVKAISNVVLINPNGSRLTSGTLEYDGNTKRAIARKNVNLTDPKQSIRTEVLYYDGTTDLVYFDDGGTIDNGENVITTKSAFYNIRTKTNTFDTDYKIDNPNYIIDGKNIEFNTNSDRANINGPTRITSKKNLRNYIYTEKGIYYTKKKEAFLEKNSRIHYNNKILTGDKMYSNQNTGYSTAKGNVKLDDPLENRYIKGGYAEVFEKKDSAMITEKPYAIKIFKKDTLFFSAQKILTYQKLSSKTNTKKSHLEAFHKARIYKSTMQGRCDSLSYNESSGEMHFYKKPLFWAGFKQISGDTIKVFNNTINEEIDSIKVSQNAFLIAKVDSLNLKDEFHQIKGKLMEVFFKKNEVNLAKVRLNAQAINYLDQTEKEKPTERIGIALSHCGEIVAEVFERELQIVSCNVGAITDVYPMNKISKEQRFFSDFNWNTKDRLRKWSDIFVDSPNYPEIKYESDDQFYLLEKQKNQDEAKKQEKTLPKRSKKI